MELLLEFLQTLRLCELPPSKDGVLAATRNTEAEELVNELFDVLVFTR
jgi:hypothetical protein